MKFYVTRDLSGLLTLWMCKESCKPAKNTESNTWMVDTTLVFSNDDYSFMVISTDLFMSVQWANAEPTEVSLIIV